MKASVVSTRPTRSPAAPPPLERHASPKPARPSAAAKPTASKKPEPKGASTKPGTTVAKQAPAKQPSATPVVKSAPAKPVATRSESRTAPPAAAKDATPVPAQQEGAAPATPVIAPEAAAPVHAAPQRPAAPAPVNGRPPVISRNTGKDEVFAEGDHVVYPTHGVGRVEKIATEEIAGHKLELIHITFEENRMTLRVPVTKARTAGLRKLATRKIFDEALAVLRGRARIKRTMWSRRAQEYEAKINSGDPLAIAEVVRDLHRNAGQPDQSFSERQIYEAAMDRLAAELGALDRTDKATAATKLADFLKTIA